MDCESCLLNQSLLSCWYYLIELNNSTIKILYFYSIHAFIAPAIIAF